MSLFFAFIIALIMTISVLAFQKSNLNRSQLFRSKLGAFSDDLQLFRGGEKKCLVGLTTDAWNIGEKVYKTQLAVHKMGKHTSTLIYIPNFMSYFIYSYIHPHACIGKKIQKNNIACVEIPLWVSQRTLIYHIIHTPIHIFYTLP